jgi:hypothetical protein
MEKPVDRLNPHCTNSWSNMESWGGKSWFPNEAEEDKEGTHDERTERFNDLDQRRGNI